MSDNHIVQAHGKPFAGYLIETIISLPKIDTDISFDDFMLEADCFGDTSKVKLTLPCWGVTLDYHGGSMTWGRFLLWPDNKPQFCDGLTFCPAVSAWLDCSGLNISKKRPKI